MPFLPVPDFCYRRDGYAPYPFASDALVLGDLSVRNGQKRDFRCSAKPHTGDLFIGLVRKYTRARKLTPRMLNELVEKIEVFNAEKIDGVWEQRLRIHYNCVGTIEIPTVLPLPIPEVSVNTRKGVVVNYAPCELAV